jgi:hypothetical protein
VSVHQALIRGSPSQSFIDFFISYARADKAWAASAVVATTVSRLIPVEQRNPRRG